MATKRPEKPSKPDSDPNDNSVREDQNKADSRLKKWFNSPLATVTVKVAAILGFFLGTANGVYTLYELYDKSQRIFEIGLSEIVDFSKADVAVDVLKGTTSFPFFRDPAAFSLLDSAGSFSKGEQSESVSIHIKEGKVALWRLNIGLTANNPTIETVSVIRCKAKIYYTPRPNDFIESEFFQWSDKSRRNEPLSVLPGETRRMYIDFFFFPLEKTNLVEGSWPPKYRTYEFNCRDNRDRDHSNGVTLTWEKKEGVLTDKLPKEFYLPYRIPRDPSKPNK